uniref:feruloyl esterase n=1 Tax=Globisporangium ultimum (strain ATCC 200006 / CBS 805.95 / DAOM BR144) TaxID=431595 RepID=K3WKK6_GLOUD
MKVFRTFLVVSLSVLAVAVDAASTNCGGSYPPTTSSAGSTAASTGSTATTASPSTASSGVGSLAVVTPVVDCANLLTANLTSIGGSGSNVTSATEVTSSGIKYCQVAGTLSTKIGWQVMLPVSTWTQRYMQIGCGGLCGSIQLSVGAADGSEEVSNGNFAMAGTDMAGGTDGTFGLDEDRVVAFAYRAVHLTALVSKQLILQYYGQKQKYAYFNGCSDGGREAVMEALRYPEDFNGIIAGAPAMLFQLQNSLHHGWLAASNTDSDTGKSILISSRLSILHDAVVAACDALDGLEDGLLSDPRLCNFDPKTIQCASDATDTSACLTEAEVGTVTKFYKGPTDSTSGKQLTVGEQQYGSELAWSGVCVPTSASAKGMSESIALAALRYSCSTTARTRTSRSPISNATLEKLRPRHPLFDAVSPDLAPFKATGGKLILWHGWADPHISPRTTIRLHEGLVDQMGQAAVDEFERMYLLPGVHHCGDGEGMSAIDLVTPMLEWVESGSPPNAIATKDAAASLSADGFGQWAESGSGSAAPARSLQSQAFTSSSGSAASVSRTRPVFPYPAVAKYIGTGDANDTANYVAGAALYTNKTAYWLGDDLFDVYAPIESS